MRKEGRKVRNEERKERISRKKGREEGRKEGRISRKERVLRKEGRKEREREREVLVCTRVYDICEFVRKGC